MTRSSPQGPYAELARRLRAPRSVYGMGSKEFDESAGVPFKSYSQWESGAFRPSIDAALRLRRRYGLSLDFIHAGSLDALPMKLAGQVAPLLEKDSVRED